MFVPIQAIPYVRLAKRLFSGQGSLQSIAYRQDTLCQEEKTTLRPAVFLPGQLDRIIRFKPTDAVAVTTKEGEIAEAIATTVVHGVFFGSSIGFLFSRTPKGLSRHQKISRNNSALSWARISSRS